MTTAASTGDLAFLTGAMTHLSGSLDIQESLIKTFGYLRSHFPIDAISLHQYSVRLKRMKLLFLVREGGFHFVEEVFPIPEDDASYLEKLERNVAEPINITKVREHPISLAHSRAMDRFIPHKDRAYLIGMLRSHDSTIGHLCLMGTHEGCFTKEHERKLSLLLTPFALTMSNLLRYKRTMEFQKRLYAERNELLKDLELLRDRRIIGEQGGLKATMDVVYQLRGREIPALILGETGTGKEMIADVIQSISPRSDKPFVKVNCGAIPEALVDSELFGYEKGAFTGASTSRPGRFEQAHGGTLFLDEVGELPLQAQVRLLRVLQNNVVERLGSTRSISVDVRIIAATNRNLQVMMQEGAFREDLYYRLYVFPINVPPLRDRKEDIPELVYQFLKKGCEELGIVPPPQLAQNAMERLLKYSWPGNVRELENLVRRGLTLSPQGPLRLEELLPQDGGWYLEPAESQSYFEKCIDARVEALLETHLGRLATQMGAVQAAPLVLQPLAEEKPVRTVRTWDDAMRDAIDAALAAAQGRIHGPGGAAELLALNPSTLRSKMRKLGIDTGKK